MHDPYLLKFKLGLLPPPISFSREAKHETTMHEIPYKQQAHLISKLTVQLRKKKNHSQHIKIKYPMTTLSNAPFLLYALGLKFL